MLLGSNRYRLELTEMVIFSPMLIPVKLKKPMELVDVLILTPELFVRYTTAFLNPSPAGVNTWPETSILVAGAMTRSLPETPDGEL